MQQKKQDGEIVVSELLATDPPRKLILNVADVGSGVLTLMEALDIAEASGFDADDFAAVMERGSLRDKAKLMYAFAWVVLRRSEPGITFETVLSYQLEVIGSAPKRNPRTAKAVVAVASLAGISPEEAKKLTMDEVAAITELHQRRTVRRTAGHRRRVG